MQNNLKEQIKKGKTLRIIFLIFLIILVCITLYIYKINATTEQNFSSYTKQNITVESLTLKYTLIDSAQEMYYVNIEPIGVFTEETYMSFGKDAYEHYLWLKNTYNEFSIEMKRHFIDLYGSNSVIDPWWLADAVKELDDDAEIDEIVKTLDYKTKDLSINEAVNEFYPYYYNNFLKDYLSEVKPKFDKRANELNREISKNDDDIIKFMEEESGISFSTDYKVKFYYSLVFIGAYGLRDDNIKISTIRQNTDYESLFDAPFHEFSHELFQTFIHSNEFIEVGELMKEDIVLYNEWIDKFQNAYSWNGFLEENLVEGFADYLSYKYYGEKREEGIYVYDLDFYNYLLEIDFDPNEISLKEASINFYKNIAADN